MRNLQELLDTLRFGHSPIPPSLLDPAFGDDEPEEVPDLEEALSDYDDIPGSTMELNDEYERHETRVRNEYRRRQSPHWSLAKRIDVALERAPGKFTTRDWRRVVDAFNGCCAYCGRKGTNRTLVIEHVLPVAQGGSTNVNNILPACRSCNREKGGARLDQWFSDGQWREFLSRYAVAFAKY